MIDAVISSSAAESTIAPLAATGRRHRDLDALRLADRLDGVVDDSGEVLEVDLVARVEPPRVEDPSRRPAASSACTWVTQPGPSCQVSLTRSAIAAGFDPAAPANLRSVSCTASVSTGPNAE